MIQKLEKPISHKNYHWDLSPLCSGIGDSKIAQERKQLEKVINTFANKWAKDRSYLTEPIKLLEALKEEEYIEKNYGISGKYGYYLALRSALNESDKKIRALATLHDDFVKKLVEKILFFRLSLGKIPESTQKKFLSDDRLAKYHHYLERLFIAAKHDLSEEQEKVVLELGSLAYGNWVDMNSEFISQEEERVVINGGKVEKKSFSQIMTMLDSHDKKERDSANRAINRIFQKYIDVAEHELNNVLGYKKAQDKLRGYTRPDQVRHIEDDIDSDVVDSLVSAVASKNSIAKRFYKLKAKIIGRRKLQYHERLIPVGSYDKSFTYEEAVKVVSKVLMNLDSEFNEIFMNFVKNRQIDVFPVKSKSDGAFCISYGISMPTYILINYGGKISDILTIAHEVGHGINNELMKKKCTPLNYGAPTSTAEVASTFMEDFVFDELLKGCTDQEKLTLIIKKLDDSIASIFRQIACYRFETDLHTNYRKKGYLPSSEIGKIFKKNMSSYLGDTVNIGPGAETWWIHWSHIRRYFYVYSYASGLLISKALQSKVRKDSKFIENVKTFLSAGETESPRDLFLDLGIDITSKKFWLDGLKEIERYLSEAEKLAESIQKTKEIIVVKKKSKAQ